FLLPPGRVVCVGCDPAADWCVADASLAPRHCELSFEDGMLIVRDLDSPRGVWIDGTRVFHAPIPAGGTLQVGDLQFQHVPALVSNLPPPAAEPCSDPARVPAAPGVPAGFAGSAGEPWRFGQPSSGDGEATVLGPAPDSIPTAVFDQPPPISSDSDDGGVTILPERFTPQRFHDGLSTIRRFGDYELLNEVARGGMGVVYRARQVSLDRIVALKMILQGEFAGEEDVVRFKREAEAAAQLSHPGIVPIYQVGQCDGQHFFTMGFIEGQSLKERVQRGPLVPREAAELLRKLAEAIAYAHRRGVVHRDLKPANVLLDLQGEPRVTDFGLARKLEQNGELTRTGAVMGTPSYMPPEQAAGKSAGVGPEADIYSLGAVLYCLLTGRPPFQAANPLDTLLQVIEGEPLSPRLLNPAIDEDLNAICLKCLEKNPADRYASAEALQADLAHFLDHEPVSIRTRTSLERLKRTLIHSRDDQELATWGDLLLVFAPLVMIPELIFQLLVGAYESGKLEHIHRWALLMRGVQLGAMLACGWWFRDRILTSRRTTTKDMWSHWAAFLIACHLVLGVQVISGLAHPKAKLSLWSSYPNFALLSGVLWFTLGSNFWGGCYAFGALHFLSALVMAWFPEIGPTLFGVLWFFSLAITGWRLKRMHRTLVDQETLSLRR
ncbi:MAG: protein kinase domain-containing protein, partial [Planctomycetaceae bacterium]